MTSHAELALFVLVCANQAGVPVPGGISLVGAGALAGSGILSFPLVVAVGVGGTLVADLVWFSLGRWRGAQALGVLGRISRRGPADGLPPQGLLMGHPPPVPVCAPFFAPKKSLGAGRGG